MRKLGNALKAGSAATLGLIFAMAVIEALPRAVPALMPGQVQAVQRLYEARNSWESMMRGDPELGFVLRPGLEVEFPSEGRKIAIRTSALSDGPQNVGFRDIGTAAPYEAIALGDSFTFCDDAPAETCWVRRLSDKLGMSVATLGVNGYSNLAEARLLEKLAPHLGSVRLVLVGFFANDFKDNLHFRNWSLSDTDDYWTWQRRKRRSDTSEFLARNSVFYRLFDAARRYGSRDTFEHREDGLDFVFRADGWWRYVLERPGETPGFHLAEEAFQKMADTAKGMDAQLVVLLFPFKEQVYWHIARRYYATIDDLGKLEESDIDAPMLAVRRALEARAITTCDLTPPLRAEARKGRQLYLRVGAHWTDEGNDLAAQAIAECLIERTMVGTTGRVANAPRAPRT